MEITIQKTTNPKHISSCRESYGEYEFDFFVAISNNIEIPFVQECFGGQFYLNSGEKDQVRTKSLLELFSHLEFAFHEAANYKS